jgi:hypothetical protein
MAAKQFLEKNQKYIVLILLALFFIKTFQSCNRNMTVNKLNKEIVYLTDSLNTMMTNETGMLLLELNKAKDSIKTLHYEVKLAQSKEISANNRADAIQSTAAKIRENTTIKIENNSHRDTVSTNRK